MKRLQLELQRMSDKLFCFLFLFLSRAVSAESKLTMRLACLRCAKMECREFDAAASDSLTDLFATAIHLADEQVCVCVCVCVCLCHYTLETHCYKINVHRFALSLVVLCLY